VLTEQGTRDYQSVEGKETLAIGVNSQPLIDRWLECLRLGCTWGHHGYHPHVAISHGSGIRIPTENLKMFLGGIILGPERVEDPSGYPTPRVKSKFIPNYATAIYY